MIRKDQTICKEREQLVKKKLNINDIKYKKKWTFVKINLLF